MPSHRPLAPSVLSDASTTATGSATGTGTSASTGTSDPAFLALVGDRIRLARARRGMTRRILSRDSGVSERYIAQLEGGTGNVSILLLRAIARALAVPIPDLLAESTDQSAEWQQLHGLFQRLNDQQRHEACAVLVDRFATTMPAERDRRVALIGLRGAGKSSLGRLLAESRRVPFFEINREIEREAGLGLNEVFELHGQAGFRRMERSVVERLVASHPEMVIAAGGSVVADMAMFERLLAQCRVVWVRASPEEHMQRVIDQGDLRPMQDNRQAMADLRAILASREALYARADLTLDTSGRSVAQSFAELQILLQ